MGNKILKRAQKKKISPVNRFALPGMLEKKISPLNDPIWQIIIYILIGSFATWFFRIIFGSRSALAILFVALVALATWLVVIQMLLKITKLKKFWTILLAIGFIFLVLMVVVPGFVYVSGSIAFVFLLFRKYKPYRHLTSRRRAALFLLGLVLFTLLTIGFPAGQRPGTSPGDEALQGETTQRFDINLAKYSLWSLRLFWFLSLFNLFFSIRLQFMRIKPKLAVSSLLITVVPVILVFLMSLVVIYSALGLSRAIRAQSILLDWASFADTHPDFIPSFASRSFIYKSGAAGTGADDVFPDWLSEFVRVMEGDTQVSAGWEKVDSVKYLWVDQELWLVDYREEPSREYVFTAGVVDELLMDRLASILHSNVTLSLTNPIRFAALGEVKVIGIKEETQQKKEISGQYTLKDSAEALPDRLESSIWQKDLYSGMTHLDVISYADGKLEDFSILLLTEGSLESFARDLISEKNPLSLVVLVGLLILFVLLLILEAFALYFGVRITGGITSAVKTLHTGTRRIAAGDLDTKIEIPNEDELGDLAQSFNEMAVAIKQGQREVLAREHMERELKTAREIQERLLPHDMPQIPGFEISGINLPSLQVGGDYFDFLELESGFLGIAIADVCGKGIPAALLMANLQASLHGQAVGPDEVASVITRMNDLLVRSTDTHMFATFVYGVLNRRSATFTSTNAGHNPPLLFQAEGKYKKLGANGLIIGFLPNQKYEQQTIQINPGDVLVLYTDGITEANREVPAGNEDKYFGEERLVKIIQENKGKSVREIQMEILSAIQDFTSNAPQNDDITLVIIKRNPNS